MHLPYDKANLEKADLPDVEYIMPSLILLV